MQVGFRISPVTMEQHSGVFTCEAKARDGRVSTHHVMLHVNSQTAFVPPPVINRTLASHVTVGQDFTVACSVTVDLSTVVELTWKTPNGRAINEGRVEGPQQSARNLSMAGTHLKIVEQVHTHTMYLKMHYIFVSFTQNHLMPRMDPLLIQMSLSSVTSFLFIGFDCPESDAKGPRNLHLFCRGSLRKQEEQE